MKKETRKQEISEVQELIEMGKFYFVNGKYDKAIEEFKKALKLNPVSPEIFYSLGLVYESRNKPEEAIRMYEKALAINPKYKLAKQHYEKLIGV